MDKQNAKIVLLVNMPQGGIRHRALLAKQENMRIHLDWMTASFVLKESTKIAIKPKRPVVRVVLLVTPQLVLLIHAKDVQLVSSKTWPRRPSISARAAHLATMLLRLDKHYANNALKIITSLNLVEIVATSVFQHLLSQEQSNVQVRVKSVRTKKYFLTTAPTQQTPLALFALQVFTQAFLTKRTHAVHVTKDSTRAPTHQTRVKIAREVSMVMKSAELLSRAHAKIVVEENLT